MDQEVAGSSPAVRPQKTTPPVGRQSGRLFDDIPDSKDGKDSRLSFDAQIDNSFNAMLKASLDHKL